MLVLLRGGQKESVKKGKKGRGGGGGKRGAKGAPGGEKNQGPWEVLVSDVNKGK